VFGRQIAGFDRDDAVLTGIESRTSSPVRITRDDETLQSLNVRGLYPCGEGAGYAGGILSAGVDGIKVAEAVGKEPSHEIRRHQETAPEEIPRGAGVLHRRRRAPGAGAAEGGAPRRAPARPARST
jgi:hypothetical protein